MPITGILWLHDDVDGTRTKRWERIDEGHRGVIASVQLTPEGRWFATVHGKPLHPSNRANALLTWETADGGRAHVERVLRIRRAFEPQQHIPEPVPGYCDAAADAARADAYDVDQEDDDDER